MHAKVFRGKCTDICLFSGPWMDLLVVSAHGGRSEGLSGVSCIRALISFMRASSSWPNHLPRALPPTAITLGVRISISGFGGHTNSPKWSQLSRSLPLGVIHQWLWLPGMYPVGTFTYELIRLSVAPMSTMHFTLSCSMLQLHISHLAAQWTRARGRSASAWMMNATAAPACVKINHCRSKW